MIVTRREFVGLSVGALASTAFDTRAAQAPLKFTFTGLIGAVITRPKTAALGTIPAQGRVDLILIHSADHGPRLTIPKDWLGTASVPAIGGKEITLSSGTAGQETLLRVDLRKPNQQGTLSQCQTADDWPDLSWAANLELAANARCLARPDVVSDMNVANIVATRVRLSGGTLTAGRPSLPECFPPDTAFIWDFTPLKVPYTQVLTDSFEWTADSHIVHLSARDFTSSTATAPITVTGNGSGVAQFTNHPPPDGSQCSEPDSPHFSAYYGLVDGAPAHGTPSWTGNCRQPRMTATERTAFVAQSLALYKQRKTQLAKPLEAPAAPPAPPAPPSFPTYCEVGILFRDV